MFSMSSVSRSLGFLGLSQHPFNEMATDRFTISVNAETNADGLYYMEHFIAVSQLWLIMPPKDVARGGHN